MRPLRYIYIMVMAGALLPSALSAQTQVTTGVQNGSKYGVTYMLPRTQVVVSAKATHHTYEPGEFAAYAERYLRMEGVRQEADSYWTLDEVSMKVVGVPDKEGIYFVEMKDRTTAPLMELTEDGVVRSINMPFSGIGAASDTNEAAAPAETDVDPRQFLTEEILMASSRARMAQLVAREIYSLRESKRDLISGNADNTPKDGAQLQIMLDNLELQESALTRMFQGKERTEQTTMEVSIDPSEMEDAVVLRFSKKLGLVDKDNLAGEPLYITIHDKKIVEVPVVDEDNARKAKQLTGVAYNVPGKADVTLTFGHQTMANEEVSLTQFGTREYLAALLFNRNATTKVLFDVNTGGLLKIERE